ncbi:MAG TPA: peptidoglycan-binding domain-containing protein, partial [Pseudorhizobium sp.]|nr:peptidoglycan-binding domain-containing protein [Pseudorhizobium sp.]
ASVEDPVAAAIRASETGRPPAAKAPPRDLGPAIAASADLVVQIQRGLSNIAYTDITVDGVAGAQTRAAIRRFEKHYRLPETGEPNELVLKKLKSIGAL